MIPDGFELAEIKSEFVRGLGQIYRRQRPLGFGLLTNETHSNTNGVIHGGVLATIADVGLFFIAADGDDVMNGATLALNLNYIAPCRVGSFVYAEGNVIRAGRSIIFAEGKLIADEDIVVTFSGTIKRFSSKR